MLGDGAPSPGGGCDLQPLVGGPETIVPPWSPILGMNRFSRLALGALG